ncbi:hypothetical protein GZH53_18255 [Flavihumibacter sp. R14]|nr:hypothetical protein [Flavihumibacter soli]
MNKQVPHLIVCASNQDERGGLFSYNEFDMAPVQRMYVIRPASTRIVRAWQAHRFEEKWFYCAQGSFEVKIVEIDDENSGKDSRIFTFNLEAERPDVLYIPGGYANGFRASTENSKLVVFSNNTLDQSKADDFRYPADKWNLWEKYE